MYSLPSTSVSREPLPPCTNSGYGIQPDHVARAVLLTPPGMERQAMSNSLPLPAVSRPSASWAAAAEAAALAEFMVDLPGSEDGRRRQHAPRRVELTGQQRRQQPDRVGEADDRGVRNRGVTAMLDQTVLGEYVIGFARGAEIRCAIADQQHAVMPVVLAHRTGALVMAAADAAVRIGERRFKFPLAPTGLHQPVGEDRQVVELITRED